LRDYNDGGGDHLLFNSSFSNLKTKSIDDTVTPGYREKLYSGEFLPINGCTIVTDEVVLIQPHSGTMTQVVASGSPPGAFIHGSHTAVLSDAVLTAFVPDSAEIDNVVIKALSSAKTADWDVLTFLGEFHDTVDLFRSVVERIGFLGRVTARKAVRTAIRRARGQHRKTSRQEIIGLFDRFWLEGRYGWRPLLYDLASALKALRHHAGNPLSRKSSSTVKDLKQVVTGGAFDNGNVHYQGRSERIGTVRYHAVVFYDDKMGPIGANPVITIWELTRFSFVFDWFINVSQWLQAISPREGFTGLGISVSVAADYTDNFIQTVSEGSAHDYSIDVTPMKTAHHVQSYQRSVYDGLPLPKIDVHLNSFKLVDLITLVVENSSAVSSILLGRK